MRIILFLSFILLVNTAIFAQQIDLYKTPLEELELRDRLESDESFLQMLCSKGKGSHLPEKQKENRRVRLLLYKAIQANDETVKAKYTCSTKEGTPVAGYVIVEKGKAKLIIDASRDKFGSLRVHSYDCNKLLIGDYGFDENKKKMIFTPVQKDENFDKRIPFFQCQTENKELVF
jgi:hypothetical protein